MRASRQDAPRVALFSAQFLPSYGGVEQFTASLARELASMGVAVTVVAANSRGAAPRESLCEGAEVYRLPCHPVAGGSFPTLRHGRELDRLWDEISAVRYDGVLVNTRFYTLSLRGMRLAREQGLRAVVLDHGSSHLGFGKPGMDWVVRDYEHAITSVGRRYDARYYGISEKSAEWLGHFGIVAEGSLNNAIDERAFRQLDSGRDFRAECGTRPSDLVVCFVGRLVPSKGTRTLLQTARLLEERRAGVRLLVAGDGPDESLLRRDKPADLILLGRLGHEDVSALLRRSDLLFLPTRTEGFCTALLEAAAWGTPSLVTNVGGAREVIPDARYGTVLEDTEPSPDECAERIEWYAEHRAEARAQGARCRERVAHEYSWPATARRVLDALDIRFAK